MKFKPPFTDSYAERILGTLPDVMRFADGSRVSSPEDWLRRRKEVADALVGIEYGGMPPATPPEATVAEIISDSMPRCSLLFPRGMRKIEVEASVSGGLEPVRFFFTVWMPTSGGSFPVVADGDGCWHYPLTEGVIADAVSHGFAFVVFNRCIFARDRNGAGDCGIYRAFPGGYGALSAWAWGYHRVYDALLSLDNGQLPALFELSHFAVTGHSRGGKTVELAAATDERIAAAMDNNSGCCGFSSSLVLGPGCETIEAITRNFPYWFGERFRSFVGREAELPFDQHFLAALIAPRILRLQVAMLDDWSNPVGACASYRAASEVFRLLGAEDNLEIVFRDGPHWHTPADFNLSFEFLSRKWACKA